MRKELLKISFVLVFHFGTSTLFAQTPQNEVADATTNFEEWFYDSLKDKALENYDKAILSLEKCLEKQPENAVINHELGRNYFLWKQFTTAEKYFIKATQIESKNKWYWIDLYEVYYETKNFPKGIEILHKIIPLDKNYREDLLSLYMYTRQHDKALLLLNELDNTEGKTERRNQYRYEISRITQGNIPSNDLENAIDKNPTNEENYLSLIQKYSEAGQEQKTIDLALKLEKNIPNSDWAQVFLFKYYLDTNSTEKALKGMDKVLSSQKIDKKIKYKMYNQLLIYTLKNTSLETQLDKYTQYFSTDTEFNVFKEVGKFYYKKKNWNLAVKNLELGYKNSNADYETNVFLLASYEEIKDFSKMFVMANELTELFPNQPEYYFFAGKASRLSNNLKKSLELLEIGLDYVVKNVALEKDFLNELISTTTALGNTAKTNEYKTRLNSLK